MDSNLVTPPDIVNNGLHSVTLVDPEQNELDTIIKFCQVSDKAFNIYVYTPNMENLLWLDSAVQASDVVIVNSRSDNYNSICMLDKCYYYGPKLYIENQKKINDPLHYFVAKLAQDK